jgi:hypothetical protein
MQAATNFNADQQIHAATNFTADKEERRTNQAADRYGLTGEFKNDTGYGEGYYTLVGLSPAPKTPRGPTPHGPTPRGPTPLPAGPRLSGFLPFDAAPENGAHAHTEDEASKALAPLPSPPSPAPPVQALVARALHSEISSCAESVGRDMENKKSMTPPSSFDPKASIIDMALPMCVPKTDGVFATTANTPTVKPASASMLASTDSDSEISSFCAESVGRDMENKKSMTPSSPFDPKASIIDMALPIGSDTQNVSTARTVIIAETGAAKTIPIENFIVSPMKREEDLKMTVQAVSDSMINQTPTPRRRVLVPLRAFVVQVASACLVGTATRQSPKAAPALALVAAAAVAPVPSVRADHSRDGHSGPWSVTCGGCEFSGNYDGAPLARTGSCATDCTSLDLSYRAITSMPGDPFADMGAL